MDYAPRIIDSRLDDLLPHLPAIALDGAKGVGKTATAQRRAARTLDLDDPGTRRLISADVHQIQAIDGTLFIDEWQREPSSWDRVRRLVDAGAPGGSFLLAGSAAPVGATIHSGAGRIVSMRMRPLSLAERGLAEPSVSLAALLEATETDVYGTSEVDLAAYVDEMTSSGFPGIRSQSARIRQERLDGYVDGIVQREISALGAAVRRPDSLRSWLRAYAAAVSTTAKYTKILDAATAGVADKPAVSTTIAYRDALTALWLLEPVEGWAFGRNHLDRLTQAPKHHLADTALVTTLLGVPASSLLRPDAASGSTAGIRDGDLLGRLFESLVTQSVRVYADLARARLYHLRQSSGRHEVDLVVERRDGRVLGVEVKLGGVDDRDVRHLLWLRDQLGDDLLDMVVVTSGPYAYRRRDGVAVVPAALLGP